MEHLSYLQSKQMTGPAFFSTALKTVSPPRPLSKIPTATLEYPKFYIDFQTRNHN